MEAVIDWLIQLPPLITQTVGYMYIFLITICEGIPPLSFLVP